MDLIRDVIIDELNKDSKKRYLDMVDNLSTYIVNNIVSFHKDEINFDYVSKKEKADSTSLDEQNIMNEYFSLADKDSFYLKNVSLLFGVWMEMLILKEMLKIKLILMKMALYGT